ncbi:Transcription factor GTE12 [Linum perenne]
MGSADTVVTRKFLKIKFTSQKVEVAPGASSCGLERKPSLDESARFQMNASQKFDSKTSVPSLKKRRSSEILEERPGKRRRMDRTTTQQCSALLKVLIGHPDGWIFSKPVDIVELKIPDYFTIISHPMDLGTISSKLSKKLYPSTEDFAADVRLTFANAMLYNPPSNSVHMAAMGLGELFEMRWDLLEEKWSHEQAKYGNAKLLSEQAKKQNCLETPPPCSASLSRNTKPSKEKTKRSSFGAQAVEVKHAKAAESCVKKSLKVNEKGAQHAHGPVNAKPSLKIVVRKCSTCGRITCGCSLQMDSSNALSDASSDGLLNGDHLQSTDVRKSLDCPPDVISTSQMSRSDPDSDGAVSAVDEDNVCPSSQLAAPTADAISGEDWRSNAVEVQQMSPKRALRAAIIKERFAHTILKAKHKTLLDNGEKADLIKMQQEKDRLQRIHHEEKARIEAQIRKAETALRRKEEMELKEQRQQEREAARAAMLKIERSVEIEENREVLKELEDLCGCTLLVVTPRVADNAYIGKQSEVGNGLGSPLERLGLFFKDETDNVDELLDGDIEDGELLA